jgi:RNA polymerase sigma-70 factor (TIGR02943 family)
MQDKMEKSAIKANPQKWLELYGDLLYQYALPRVNDNIVAQDLVQETFLSALKGLDGYKGEASEKNWLFAILKNKIIDHYRKKATEQAIVTMPDLNAVEDDWFNDEGRWAENKIPKDWHDSESPAERKEIQRIINWCKDHLKALQQHVFTLKYMEDLNSDEICKVLNISSSNYWVLIHRARLQMRDCVEKYWLKN